MSTESTPFHLAVLDATPSDAPPSHLAEQLVEQDAAIGIELLGHDDFTGNDAAGVLRALQSGESRRHWMVVALDRLPEQTLPPSDGVSLPRVPGRGPLGEVRLLGAVHAGIPLQENTDRLDMDLWVVAGARRQGVGTALHDAVEELARNLGRHVIDTYSGHARSAAPGSPDALDAPTGFGTLDRTEAPTAFALAKGYRLVQTETHSELRPADGLAVADALDAEARPLAADYEVVTWSGATPEEHLEGMCRLYERMSTDIPQGDAEREQAVWSPERIRENESRWQDMGRHTVFAMARHTPTGQAVAYTYLQSSPHRPAAAYQEDTLVAREHRGHRLGTLVKTAALRRFAAERPGVERIHTWNAGENAHMLAINTALGFRPVSLEGIWEKRMR
ncbi:GNAT family N-acetyltransferase [Kytococcus sedentarius]|uniref:GNAT family N-acetyltransferase n=1 Tax=Kytococcus sedentarius TaxID=1276 RepID=UPI0035BC0AA8